MRLKRKVTMHSVITLPRRRRTWPILSSLLIGALLLAANPALADNPKRERILRPDATFEDKTYNQWAASFWQWMMGLPLEGHPALDTSSFDFSEGQSGDVWYWAAPDGPITRTVTLPAGKAFFLSIRDVETSTLEDPPFFGVTDAEQRANSKWWANHITNVFCIVDGVAVENLQAFRFSTPQFQFTAPTPWIFASLGGTGTSVGDGYFLMFPSLSKGTHTIHYGGTFHFEAGELGDDPLDLPHDVTIQLTVARDRDSDDRHQNEQ
jgi:hypothetical protein